MMTKNGRGFMKQVKEKWDDKQPEYATTSMQKLRDNSSRFKKDVEIMNLGLVRKSTGIKCQYENLKLKQNSKRIQ